jgi:hypothetical protein
LKNKFFSFVSVSGGGWVGAQEGQRGGKQMVVGDRLVDVPKCALHPTEPLHNYFLFVNRMIKKYHFLANRVKCSVF